MNYFEVFFIGLLDGDGSLQVNHWRSQILQYRIVIKLKNTEANFNMLTLLQKNLNFGYVAVSKKKIFVLFLINNKTQINKCFILFKNYPPLTMRLRCQIVFMEQCLKYCDITWYFSNRNLKYNINLENINYDTFYFKAWLSGFIEAEGCFTLRINSSKGNSFSIAQKNEKELMHFIGVFFDKGLKVSVNKFNMYSISIYKKDILDFLSNHFVKFPLLGEKLVSFQNFKSHNN